MDSAQAFYKKQALHHFSEYQKAIKESNERKAKIHQLEYSNYKIMIKE